ncbi:GAF domain-containing protein [Streptomyces niveiscabiei]|uniref:sensor histidine kinase n=1 Tax=Streptomyces niveiscabiei TaxID=164115 RepID=UPI0029A30800|nr:GAF domain-containing protein [Streptomyces niveiscabiei]MDX3387230.1 GAF domain-containing protein [Streptomyces niveiscabiei]
MSTESGGPLRRLRLDDLLDELHARIGAVRSTRDRVQSLLQAVLDVGCGLELSPVLHRVVEAAVTLADAEYGALGVIGEDRRLSAFVPVGMSEETQERIGPLPRGHGLLGTLIRNPEPVRTADVAGHPDFRGFPEHHPPMRSFLGVPIRVRDEVFGNLYLTNRRGAPEFDAEDEAVVSALAVAAGVAIDNARLYEEARRRETWLAAAAEITSALLADRTQTEVLRMVAWHALRNVSADLGAVLVRTDGGRALRTAVSVGEGAEFFAGLRPLPRAGLLATALTGRGAVAVDDLARELHVGEELGLGVAVLVPLGVAGSARGVLLLARGKGRAPFGTAETGPLVGFAAQAAVGIELAERRKRARRTATDEERERVMDDLHDVAVQRLFALGMGLAALRRLVKRPPDAVERMARLVDDLDTTIKLISSAVLRLRLREHQGTPSLWARVAATVEQAAGPLGLVPVLRMEGVPDGGASGPVADQATAMLTEALDNVARHARARSVDVRLVAGDGMLAVDVTDDGTGIPEGVVLGGLADLEVRAAALGGGLVVEIPPGGGTRLRWRVPLTGRPRPTTPGT